ncbi:MAG: putative holin [Mycobacterium sp.]|nr:putative holin [Mycobacterium sp.]
MIPLPRAWLLTSALLLGCVAGQISAVVAKMMVDATIRPDLVVALVIGVPSVLGLLLVLCSGRRWVTTAGAFILAMAPGWLSVLLLLQVVSGD